MNTKPAMVKVSTAIYFVFALAVHHA
jgi:hypothetical protein